MLNEPKSRRWVLGAAAVGIPTGLATYKAARLSAGPGGAKDCGPPVSTPSDPPSATATLNWEKKGGSINDVSCLSRTPVAGVVRPKNEQDIADALRFARDNNLKVSMAGARHSMGGHAFAKDGVILDMTAYNAVKLNAVDRTIRVQSGATWHDIQNVIHPKFAVKAMQSSDVFTVGGSISVNAHGMDHHVGAIERTIKSFRFMGPDGAVTTLSRTQNSELYRLVVGGYGLFGVILDVELEVTDNTVYTSSRRIIDYKDFAGVFASEIEPDRNIGLFYGHLSTAPGAGFLRELILYSYHDAGITDAKIPPLGDVSMVWLRRLIFNLAKEGDMFARLKWYAEKRLEPAFESCSIDRASAQSKEEACFVSRNEPMHDSVPYLFNALAYETDILHEYFIPRANVVAFLDDMRALMIEEDTKLLNASLRVVHKEDVVLNYALEDAFSVVLYINQRTTDEGNEKMKKLTRALIDLADRHGGRFFLPYQIHYDASHLKRSYPMIGQVFEEKRKYDPTELFSNRFYETFRDAV